jgi:hypothetical protein
MPLGPPPSSNSSIRCKSWPAEPQIPLGWVRAADVMTALIARRTRRAARDRQERFALYNAEIERVAPSFEEAWTAAARGGDLHR